MKSWAASVTVVQTVSNMSTAVVSNAVKWLNEFHIKHETWVGSVVQGYQCSASWMSLPMEHYGRDFHEKHNSLLYCVARQLTQTWS